mmetsp:Transcript_45363/g.97254  ORF Transcript_45363/g.97254 Transcript_45363/m.97254 type:complete len:131 (-) Transcript_45363:647-1039(-)
MFPHFFIPLASRPPFSLDNVDRSLFYSDMGSGSKPLFIVVIFLVIQVLEQSTLASHKSGQPCQHLQAQMSPRRAPVVRPNRPILSSLSAPPLLHEAPCKEVPARGAGSPAKRLEAGHYKCISRSRLAMAP